MRNAPATASPAFVPCSAKHKHCTPAHAALVWGYRAERARQEAELDAITGAYPADRADYFARGGAPLITFAEWLKAHKRAVTPVGAIAAEVGRAFASLANVVAVEAPYVPDAADWATDYAPAW